MISFWSGILVCVFLSVTTDTQNVTPGASNLPPKIIYTFVDAKNLNNETKDILSHALDNVNVTIPSGGTHVYLIGLVGVLPALGAALWWLRRRCKRQHSRPKGPKFKVKETSLNDNLSHTIQSYKSDIPSSNYIEKSKQDLWEIPKDSIKIISLLGEGNFGQVHQGVLCVGQQSLIIAVKAMKGETSISDKNGFLSEVNLMKTLGTHPNVVQFLGCCTEREPFWLLLELLPGGSLLHHLRSHRAKQKYYNTLSSQQLVKYAYQISCGMEYLFKQKILHRDLAARNVLMGDACKIADFGLARRIDSSNTSDSYEQKSKGALPIRWMAPECLSVCVFTSKSDVWSFGVLLWEIVTLGSTPYPGLGAMEVVELVKCGGRMALPPHCHPKLYSIMTSCWRTESSHRPTFNNLRQNLSTMLEKETGYINLQHFPTNLYYNVYQSPGEKV